MVLTHPYSKTFVYLAGVSVTHNEKYDTNDFTRWLWIRQPQALSDISTLFERSYIPNASSREWRFV